MKIFIGMARIALEDGIVTIVALRPYQEDPPFACQAQVTCLTVLYSSGTDDVFSLLINPFIITNYYTFASRNT